jgi:hypothetical protein
MIRVCIQSPAKYQFSQDLKGVMGGVNTTQNYAKLMGFGYYDKNTQLVQVTKPLLQGGIVRDISRCLDVLRNIRCLAERYDRLRSITSLAHSSVPCGEAGWATNSDALAQ